MDRRSIYANYAIDIRERQSTKVRSGLDKNSAQTVKKFLQLTQLIPNWETYLTDKQLEATKLYLGNRDLIVCDIKLGLTKGGTYTRIFGDKFNQHYGAIGRLIAAYQKLSMDGYFDENKKTYLTKEERI